MKLNYDYSELIGLMAKQGFTKSSLARKINMSDVAMRNKFNHKSQFKQSDISSICEVLNIEPKEMADYFFKI